MVKQLTSTLTLLAIAMITWSQVTVTGGVIAKEDNSALPQVNVVEKGTQNGTTTDSNGTFSLNVANPNSILIFSFIGMVTQEYSLKGQQQVFIKMKTDCNKDFFDSQRIEIYANSGLLNDPIGGQITVVSLMVLRGVIKGSFSYQSNLEENEFRNDQIDLSHYVSNCDFDMDFRWNYKTVSFSNELNSKAYSFETDLNLRKVKIIAGYSHLDFRKTEITYNKNLSGIVIGIGTYFNIPLYPAAIIKVALYKGKVEYQASIQGGHKRFLCFVKFYKLDVFNELSVGIGSRLGYRLKRKKG